MWSLRLTYELKICAIVSSVRGRDYDFFCLSATTEQSNGSPLGNHTRVLYCLTGLKEHFYKRPDCIQKYP